MKGDNSDLYNGFLLFPKQMKTEIRLKKDSEFIRLSFLLQP